MTMSCRAVRDFLGRRRSVGHLPSNFKSKHVRLGIGYVGLFLRRPARKAANKADDKDLLAIAAIRGSRIARVYRRKPTVKVDWLWSTLG
jgi:hypothetical protein